MRLQFLNSAVVANSKMDYCRQCFNLFPRVPSLRSKVQNLGGGRQTRCIMGDVQMANRVIYARKNKTRLT